VNLLPPSLERLIGELSKLPGVGRKTAQRLAFHLLQVAAEDAEALAHAIAALRADVQPCPRCFHLAQGGLCAICSDPRRRSAALCVVEEPTNVVALERTGAFDGRYHVLGGALSPLRDIGPDRLRLRELTERVRDEGVEEVILATNSNVEGEATAAYLARLLEPLGVRVTRLAQGLPAGGHLEFSDDLTLRRALEGRREY
jgi:recombination protein RecR